MSSDQSRKQAQQTPQADKPAPGVLSRFLALEPRVLLDAAAVETADKIASAAAADSTDASHAAVDSVVSAFGGTDVVVSPLAAGSGAREILFIDSGIADYQALIKDLGAGVEVHVLQAGDWAAQIQSALGLRNGDVSSIHIVSHGGAGHLDLGGDVVDLGNLDQYSRAWNAIEHALTPDGDLMLYGCDVAAGDTGHAFVEALAARTSADVAASVDLTGVAALGGNWQLEASTGHIEANSLYHGNAYDFMGVLSDGWVQDTEISSGTSSVAMTHTTDGKDWKFVGTSGSNKVDIYVRNTSTGNWGLVTTVTGQGSGNFGFDLAAAGNKLVVSAPAYNTNGSVYIYSYNGTDWTSNVQTIADINATGSGQTGSGSYGSNQGANHGSDQWGYSVDIAWDGGTGYRLVIGNPNEDWWTMGSNGWGSSSQGNTRDDAGIAMVFSSAGSHTATFGKIAELASQNGGTSGAGNLFGSVVAAGYDVTAAKWWVAVGGDNLNQVWMYRNPTANTNGGTTTTDGGTYTIQKFGWTSTGSSNNDVSMDDDYMSIAGGSAIQFYKISGGATWATGATINVANAAVSIDDWDQTATGDSQDGARVIFSYSGVTGIADINPSTGGAWVYWFQLSTNTSTAVSIDRYYSIDMLTTNGTNAQSYHYNWDPTTANDSATTTEDANVTISNILANDSDTNIVYYPNGSGGSIYGDALAVTGVGTSQYGATITYTSTSITYNPTAATALQQLAVGQSVVDSFTVTISDGQGGSKTETVSITVNGVNDAPVVSQTPLSPFAYQQSGSTVSYDFSSYFYDIDSGEDVLLVYDATSLPAGWSFAASGTMLNITIPAGATAGNNTITIRAMDPNSAYSTTNQNFVINVDTVNNAPVVSNALPDQVALATYSFAYTIPSTAFTDPDPAPYDTLSYTATLSSGGALPAWLSFDPTTRTFTGTPAAGDVGSITVRVTATDDAGTRGRTGGNLGVFDDFILSVVNPSIKSVAPMTDGPRSYANFGFSTAISEDGNWLAVGAPGDDTDSNGYSDGSVWFYQWNGSGWTYISGINGPAATAAAPGIPGSSTGTSLTGNEFGWSLDWSTDGTKLVIGARGVTNGQGAVYCYTRSGTTFTLNGILTAANPVPYDFFGSSVAINEGGTYVLIGAPGYDYDPDGTGTTYDPLYSDAGAAFMAAFPAANGALTANVIPKDLANYDHFGSAVGFDQNLLVVSSPLDDNPSGIVSLFKFSETAGTSASQTVGVSGGTINSYAQFVYDGTRGDQVLSLGLSPTQGGTGNGMMLMNTPIDIGSSWSVSSWYNNIESSAPQWRTLTRGTDGAGGNHQIIVQAGSNLLGAYNNSGSGVIAGFNPIGSGEKQQAVITSTNGDGVGTFTMTLGGVTTGAITWSTTNATLASRIQSALNTALGGSYTTVAVTAANTYSITFSAGGDLPQMTATALAGGSSTLSTITNGTNYALTAGQLSGWHNIIAVGEGGGTTYYIDGVKVGASLFKPTDDIYAVGNYQGGGQRFADSIDDFRIYDRALTWGEIVSIGKYKQVAVESAYSDVGSVYVFSTDNGNAQASKLYASDGKANDQLGWAVDVDVYDLGGTRMSSTIVASSIYNDEKATDGGAVYVFNSSGLQSGGTDWGGIAGYGLWTQQAKITSYDETSNDYFGSDVAYDYDETTGGSRLVVGAQFEDSNGTYSGAVYAYAYSVSAKTFLPEKFIDSAPQGGSVTNSAFFGNSVSVAYVDSSGGVRAAFGARWRDQGGQINDGAVFWANLKTQGNYNWDTLASVSSTGSTFLPVSQDEIVNLDTSKTQGTVSFDASGQLVYSAGDAFKTLGLGQTATDTFVYVTENAGNTYYNTVTVTVYGQATLSANNDVVSVSAASPTLLNVLANDSNPTGGASAMSIMSVTGDNVLGRVYNTGSALVFDPRGQFDSLRAGQSVQETLTYTVLNTDGQQVSANVTLIVVGAEDPVVAADDSVSVKADGAVTIDVLANDTDPDGAGTFQLESVDASGALGSLVANADGTISYVPGAAFRYLKAGETATDRFVYTVIDDTGNRSSALVSVLVVGVNDAPAATNDLALVAPGGTVKVDALANDVDPDGDPVHITRVITDGTRGQVTLNADGTFSYTGPSDLVVDSFKYEVADSLGKTSTATVYINWPADPSTTPVVPGAINDVAVTRGVAPVTVPVLENDSLRLVTSIDVAPGSAGTVTVDGTNLIYTPADRLARLAAGSVFIDTFSYAVQYTDGSMSLATVRVYVNGTFVSPVLQDDEEARFALAHGVSPAAAAAPVAEAPRATPADPHFAPPQARAAAIALDGMVEISNAEAAQGDAPADAAPAAAPGDAPAAQPDTAPSAQLAPAAKPGLAALIGREALAKRASVDTLVRHLAGNAA